jgi:glucose-6-phosphate isomerase
MAIKLSGPALAKLHSSSAVYQDLLAIAPRLAAKDHTLWGVQAEAEAAIRLNWIDLPTTSRDLLPELDALSAWARSRNLNHIILAGMGGSSLAPEVISKTYKKSLTVLDSTDPAQIAAAIPTEFTQTVIVVGSKSGSTIETASHRALFAELITAAGLNPIDHIVIVTDPGSPLDTDARASGYRVINADPHVGGRYSALSAFGLVPAVLMGVDPSLLIDDAAAVTASFTGIDSPAIAAATILVEQTDQNIAFYDEGSSVPGLSDWIEQLVAESTGKNQVGRLPIVVEGASASVAGAASKVAFAGTSADLIVEGTLGEQFIFWEYVTALIGRALKVDPFNQPNVTEAKDRTGALLAQWGGSVQSPTPTLETENLAIYGTTQGATPIEILRNFFNTPSHYVAIMAYLHRGKDDLITESREMIARHTNRGVTFGWGPRFLHSTGQFHKGGQHNGAFLQITGDSMVDIAIPGKEFSFHTLLMAQALGDAEALASRNFPQLRVHLKNREKGIVELVQALRSL